VGPVFRPLGGGIHRSGCACRRRGEQIFQALAINAGLGRHLAALKQAIQENGAIIRDMNREREASDHLRALRAEAAAALRQIGTSNEDAGGSRPSGGPSP